MRENVDMEANVLRGRVIQSRRSHSYKTSPARYSSLEHSRTVDGFHRKDISEGPEQHVGCAWEALAILLVAFLDFLPSTSLAANECSVFRRGKESGEHLFTTELGALEWAIFPKPPSCCGPRLEGASQIG